MSAVEICYSCSQCVQTRCTQCDHEAIPTNPASSHLRSVRAQRDVLFKHALMPRAYGVCHRTWHVVPVYASHGSSRPCRRRSFALHERQAHVSGSLLPCCQFPWQLPGVGAHTQRIL
eukprot:689417-Rhodomonas_salina.3